MGTLPALSVVFSQSQLCSGVGRVLPCTSWQFITGPNKKKQASFHICIHTYEAANSF